MAWIDEVTARQVLVTLQPLTNEEEWIEGMTAFRPTSRQECIDTMMDVCRKCPIPDEPEIEECDVRAYVAKGILRLKLRGRIQHVGDDFWLSNSYWERNGS